MKAPNIKDDIFNLPIYHQKKILIFFTQLILLITVLGSLTTLVLTRHRAEFIPLLSLSFVCTILLTLTVILINKNRIILATIILSGNIYLGSTLIFIPFGLGGSNVATISLFIPLILLCHLWGYSGAIFAILSTLASILFIATCQALGIVGWAAHERFPIVDIVSISTLLLLISFIITRYRRETTDLTISLREANAQLRRALQEIERQAIEEERRSMALELHDGIGHHLHALRLHAEVLQRMLEHLGHLDTHSVRALSVILSEAHHAQAEITRMADLAYNQRTPVDEKPLEELLAQPARACQLGGVNTHLELQGQPAPLGTLERHMLYRVAQEAATNIWRHSCASQASFTLDYRDPQHLLLIIEDNGVGLPPHGQRGHGLRNIRERVSLLGGQLELHSAPNQGVRLWISVPRSVTSSPTTTPSSAKDYSACSSPTLT